MALLCFTDLKSMLMAKRYRRCVILAARAPIRSATRVNMRHFLVKMVVWLAIAVDLSSVKHIGELGKCIGGLDAVVLADAHRYGSI